MPVVFRQTFSTGTALCFEPAENVQGVSFVAQVTKISPAEDGINYIITVKYPQHKAQTLEYLRERISTNNTWFNAGVGLATDNYPLRLKLIGYDVQDGTGNFIIGSKFMHSSANIPVTTELPANVQGQVGVLSPTNGINDRVGRTGTLVNGNGHRGIAPTPGQDPNERRRAALGAARAVVAGAQGGNAGGIRRGIGTVNRPRHPADSSTRRIELGAGTLVYDRFGNDDSVRPRRSNTHIHAARSTGPYADPRRSRSVVVETTKTFRDEMPLEDFNNLYGSPQAYVAKEGGKIGDLFRNF